MAKVYLFRQLSGLNQQQSEVSKEAISSVLDDVFKGNTGTIYNYGEWPLFSRTGDQCDDQDLLGRILNNLFSHVYVMEVTMELHICINYVLCKLNDESSTNPHPNDHFVASPFAAYLYIKRVISQLLPTGEGNDYSYLRFSICVRQRNREKSLNLNGKLQLVHFKRAEPDLLNKLTKPIGSLLKLISILANNEKTHLRYHNIRLDALLKKLLGHAKSTVILNFTKLCELPQQQCLTVVNTSGRLWRALYMRQLSLYRTLKDKLLSLEFWSSSGRQLQLDDLIELLNKSIASRPLKLEVRRRLGNQIQQSNKSQKKKPSDEVLEELQKIKMDAKENLDNMLKLQDVVAKLAMHVEQNVQQLEQKNKTISRLENQLSKANNKMHEQRILFKRNLALYSEMFQRLWRQQSSTLKLQEQQRDAQLSAMFDTICNELHNSCMDERFGR